MKVFYSNTIDKFIRHLYFCMIMYSIKTLNCIVGDGQSPTIFWEVAVLAYIMIGPVMLMLI